MNETRIKPIRGFINIDWKELWKYRELFYFLAWKDIKVRYKQTIIGIGWAVLQPFLTMVIFSIFFGRVAGISSGEIPYPIFVYAGLLFWNYFSNSLNSASSSLVSNQKIIQKIYFPHLIMPISSTIVHLVDFFFAALIFVGLMFYYHFIPTFVGILLIIPCLLITFLSFSGLGLAFSVLNVKYRDVRYALPFFIQLLVFVTPVIYPTSVLGRYQWLWYLNPMSGVVETMRAGLLGVGATNWALLASSVLMSTLLFVFGILYFKKSERYFADII
ncbi:ABC transporter permease [Patescibacteria group bacterium]|nr:ABC transporter permease [Patescibacteria group bacterium]